MHSKDHIFIPKSYNSDSNGRLFQSRNHKWVFKLQNKEYRLEFIKAPLGRKKVILNGEILGDSSSYPLQFYREFRIIQAKFRFDFTISGCNFWIFETDVNKFELSCEGQLFSGLLLTRGKHQKIEII